jgi:hypothetical protein
MVEHVGVAGDDGSAGSSATPGNPDMLDHALLSEPPVNTAAQAVCTPEMQARVNNAIFSGLPGVADEPADPSSCAFAAAGGDPVSA